MARKDVELVIRAKDEAAKAVNSVTAAINQLVDAQGDLKKSAGASDSALGKLGAALGELDKNLRGATVGSQIARSLDSASKAAGRLEGAVANTAKELSDLQKKSNDAAAATGKLTAQATAAAISVEREAAALAKAKQAVADQSTIIRRATSDRQKLIDAEARLGAQITEQQAKVATAAARYAALGDEIAKTANPAKSLTNSLEAAGAAVDKQESKLNELKVTIGTVRAAIGQTANVIDRLTNEFSQVSATVAKQESALNGAKQEYVELQAAVRSATQTQKALAQSAEQAADSLDTQKASLDRAQAELTQLGVSAEKADASLAQLSAGATAQLASAMGKMREAAKATRAELTTLTKDVAELSAAMDIIGPPTREQVVALGRLTVAMQAAEKGYVEQLGALGKLGAILKETGGDVDAVRDRVARFAAIQGAAASALNKIAAEAVQADAAYDKLAVAADNAGRAVRSVASAGGGAPPAGPVNSLAEAWRRVYGESRQALSITQRLRGEVLSLVAAYGGLYGVINVLGQAVTAYQTLEAAQSRLNAVFRDNPDQAGQELDFIRRNADRLGISFGQLADEYTKFAAATKGTSLEGEKTRKIFISVSEAARVNKLSFEDLQGVFRALTQIASKGRVQLEELSGQLGDRLPGALQIMADGLGVTTAELLAMTKQGEVTADGLVGFAEELDRRFGSSLAKSLETTTTAMGQMQNAAFQALLTFANAGFIESFTDLIRDLTETMQSADFTAFISRLSSAIGVLLDAIGLLVQNFQLVTAAAAGFAAIKILPIITGMIAEYTRLRGVMALATAGFVASNAAMTASAATAGTASVAFGRLTLAIRALMSSTGIGLIVTAISVGIGYWATNADAATEALTSHKKSVDQVKNAYDKAGGSAEKFATEIKSISAAKVRADLDDLREALDDLAKPAGVVDLKGPDQGLYREITKATDAFNAGKLTLAEYTRELNELPAATADGQAGIDEFVRTNLELATAVQEARDQIAEAEATLALLKDPTDEAAKAVLGLNDAMTDGAAAAGAGDAKLKTYTESINKLKEAVPELAAELKKLKELAAIDEAYQAAINSAQTIGQANAAYAQREAALAGNRNFEADYTAQRGTPQGAQMEELIRATTQLAEQMGLSAKDLLTAMSYETAGTFDPWKAGPTTQWGQHRGLIQWGEPQAARYGVGADTSITDQVQAAGKYLTDAGVKAGDGLLQIYAAINAGNAKNTGASDANNGGAPGTVLDKVQGQMAGHQKRAEGLLAAYAGITEEVVKQTKAQDDLDKKAAAAAEKKTADAAAFHEQQAANIEQQQFELSVEQQGIIDKQVALALRDAENAAKAKGTELTEAERQKIIQVTTEKYKQAAAEEAANAKKQTAAEAEQRVNDLLTQQTQLQQQIALYKEQGNNEKVAETEAALANVNTQLQAAIANATAMHQAIGGAGADASIAKLQTMALEGQKVAQSGQQSFLDWGRVGQMFASGLTNAFDKFAQAVANGEDIGKAAADAFLQFAADFLKQIAQMIIQQAILNALQSFGLGGGGGVGGAVGGLFHRGGVVGAGGGQTRRADPAIWNGAARYHTGGIAGLKPGEVPAILKKDEEVLTESDPRHIFNGGGLANLTRNGEPVMSNIKVVNAIDSGSFIDAGLNSKVGERAILNFIRANASAVKNALG